ncbi:Predicted membrane protein [Phaffia rhodozyma]|uniref:Post-GPI attachment to proteins factor 3 n=1 Tax=Phaffia rhodozyma TaxID=264483 RepID=A0A0F7SJ47_PHARH|nr:Predicted membrane protein [Phaffia rhodozyma]
MGIIRSSDCSKLLLTLAAVFFISALPVMGSSGDRLPSFRICLEDCTQSCTPHLKAITTTDPFLWLTRWTCEDECKYDCMNDVVQIEGVQQFYGKWPFRRLLGMQEPASVFFSIANGVMHFRGIRSSSRRIPKSSQLRGWYLAWGYAGLNTWVWSSVFHTRDKPWTEKMDYFSAGFGITFSLLLAIVRIWHLYLPPSSTTYNLSSTKNLSAGNSLGASIGHSRRLQFNPWALFWTILFGTIDGPLKKDGREDRRH